MIVMRRMRMVMMMMMMQGLHDLAESISSTQVTYHFQCTITPPLIRVAALAPKLNWVRSPGGVVLRSPCISLQLLINLENTLHVLRGEMGAEARGPGNLKSSPKSCCLLIHAISQGIFKDPDEQYTSDLSLPVHHTPP